MRRRELGARARLTSSSALDCSVPPPAIASSRTEGGSREVRRSVRRGAISAHGAVRVAAGVGGRRRRRGGAEGVPGGGAGAAVPVLHLPALRRHARLLAQVQEDLSGPRPSRR
uniref:Uncharacterized protein n=1 Tax=Setaria viridis TaxID=4556 RepID=A0A4U6T111_SETVI|nr:hypothetical protein SEVIR_9G342201v2 [Setaria viridis]